MKRALLISSAAVAITAIAAPIAAIDVEVHGRVRVNLADTDVTLTDTMGNNDAIVEAGYATGGGNVNSAMGGLAVHNSGLVSFIADSAANWATPNIAVAQPAVGAADFAGGTITASQAGLGNVAAAPGKFAGATDGRVDVSASASNCCLKYGAFTRLDHDSASITDVDSHIWMSGDSWGKVQLGTDISAEQGVFDLSVVSAGPSNSGMQVTVAGFTPGAPHTADTLGKINAGNIAEQFDGNGIAGTSLVYTGNSMGGLVPAIEIDAAGEWAASLKYSGDLGGTTVGLTAYMDKAKRKALMATATMGDITAAGYTGKDGSGEKYMGGGVKYSMGKLALSADMSKSTSNDVAGGEIGFGGTEKDMYIGMSYAIADGLSFNASYGTQEATINSVYQDLNTTNPATMVANTTESVTSKSTSLAARLTLNF